ncbi:hypothetical protein PISMIDRAFT_671174 [Pisolithus microcarpus 441]|uniref:Uncharacterized protein n=1 Tax=Pisolithus microcarpus 441 TaxID=765257 RepID=A0A0C9ZVR9_9AGAM|nr:hypothetical protein PISMIDRAFT_671174 [Pisolithus microcarpus 441]
MRLRGVEKDDMLQLATYRSLQPTACRDAICSSRRFSVTYAPSKRPPTVEAGSRCLSHGPSTDTNCSRRQW